MGIAVSVPQLLIIVLVVAVMIWPYWRIFRKAGFAPWLALLMIVPAANIIMIFFLAFARWPALDKALAK